MTVFGEIEPLPAGCQPTRDLRTELPDARLNEPSTFLSVGQLDLFIEENIEYVRRLIRAGVLTELHIHPGALHGLETAPTAKVAQRFRAEYMGALKRG